MTVDQTGKVTTLQKGEPVTITVKSNDSGIEKDVILNPYVRAKSISFSNSIPTLLIKNKTGVEVTETAYSLNDNKTFNIGLTVIGENDGEASAVPVINITGDSIITIKDGKATLGDNAGVATVTAFIDGEASPASFTITILDFDIVEGGEKITGTSHNMKGGISDGNEYNLSLSLLPTTYNSSEQFNNLGFSSTWCFDNSPSKNEDGTWGSTRNLIKSNNFTAKLYRCRLSGDFYAADIDVTALINKDNSRIATISFRAVGAKG